MCSRNWKLLEGINSENLLSESDLGLRLELLNGIFYTVNRRVQKLPGFWWVPAGSSLSEQLVTGTANGTNLISGWRAKSSHPYCRWMKYNYFIQVMSLFWVPHCDPVTICHDTKVMFREHNTPSILQVILLLLHQRDHWDMWLQQCLRLEHRCLVHLGWCHLLEVAHRDWDDGLFTCI